MFNGLIIMLSTKTSRQVYSPQSAVLTSLMTIWLLAVCDYLVGVNSAVSWVDKCLMIS